jgi:hypothetical protein
MVPVRNPIFRVYEKKIARLEKENAEAQYRNMMLACEFGYKACERHENLEMALSKINEILKGGKS